MNTTPVLKQVTCGNLSEALNLAQEEGLCQYVRDVAEGVSVCDPLPNIGWAGLARETIQYLPGVLRVLSGNNTYRKNSATDKLEKVLGGGLSWVNGGNGPHGIVLSTGTYRELRDAREVMRRFFGPTIPLKATTLGQMAKLLLAYTADEQKYECDAEVPLKGIKFGYHDCTPGEYEWLDQYDCSGYYYNLLCSLPSFRIYPHSRGFETDYLREQESEAWHEVKHAISDCKLLRNALVGVMCGSLEKSPGYTRAGCSHGQKSRIIQIPGKAGPFRAAGLMVVRGGYELCRAESLHNGSKYSTIDCISVPRGRTPQVWPRYGFPVSLRYSGPAQICSRGVYKIGERETFFYRKGDRTETSIAPAHEPPFIYTAKWLTPQEGMVY